MGFLKFLNDNAAAIGVIFAVLSGVTVAVTFIWKMALRYQKIEDKLESSDANTDDKFTALHNFLDLKFETLEEKVDAASIQMQNNADKVKDASKEINEIKEKLNGTITKIAVIEARGRHNQ